MGALQDCEAVVHAVLGQPVNSLTTLAFLAGGAIVILRTPHVWIGIASIATGVGSFVFHGPMPPYGEWVHDFTLAWLLLVVGAHGRSWERWSHLPGLAVLAGLVLIPGAGDPLGAALAAMAIVLLLLDDRTM